MNDEQPEPTPLATGGKRHRLALVAGGTAIALGIAAGGIGIGLALHPASDATASRPATVQPAIRPWKYGNGSGSDSTPQTTSGTPATSAQKVGVVTIVSKLEYDGSSEAAGTGIILTRNGEILTNNHVVEGATSITVTVESTDTSYTAKVVGTDATDDVAVLQLVTSSGAKVSGLTAAAIDADTLAVGAAVTDVGNAEGTGDLVAASGTVAALDRGIQVRDEISGDAKNLTGLIEVNADVVSGDSGGPLLDAQGEVTGMVTAASSGTRDVTGYAIPIATAVAIAKKIEAGQSSNSIVIGLPAFLGVELAAQQSGSGVLLQDVIPGQAAQGAGLVGGDTITSVDGVAVGTPQALTAAITAHRPGDRVTLGYTDAAGASQQVAVALGEGPAA